jgi:hypothetical protein
VIFGSEHSWDDSVEPKKRDKKLRLSDSVSFGHRLSVPSRKQADQLEHPTKLSGPSRIHSVNMTSISPG